MIYERPVSLIQVAARSLVQFEDPDSSVVDAKNHFVTDWDNTSHITNNVQSGARLRHVGKITSTIIKQNKSSVGV